MRQSITTKYIVPTDTHLSGQVRAKSCSGRLHAVEWNPNYDAENHKNAALALARKLGWHGTWQAGSIPTGCVFVLLDGDTFEA